MCTSRDEGIVDGDLHFPDPGLRRDHYSEGDKRYLRPCGVLIRKEVPGGEDIYA